MAKSIVAKNVSASGNGNVLDDSSHIDVETTTGRPMKKGAKNKRKKMERQNDVYFCDAPSKNWSIVKWII